MKEITLSKKDFQKIKKVRNREGQLVPFDINRVSGAILKALQVTQEGGEKEAKNLANLVFRNLLLLKEASEEKNFAPNIELIQDLIEKELILAKLTQTSKAYILYREARSRVRKEYGPIPENVRNLMAESKKYFKNSLAEFVFFRSYARWIEDEKRRETWIETVDRYLNFMEENVGDKISESEYKEIREAILKQEVMPSMRLMQFSGLAAKTTNVCAYNCSFVAPSTFQDFGEIMYILMCGAGVGFTVESNNIQSLPQIKFQTKKNLINYTIDDTKEGWADALILGMQTWYDGGDIKFDYSKLRPAGARLKTMGGKSSGPDPLRNLLNFTRERILRRQGRRLFNLDAHDIICKIGECVVSGGVRRSAMISLSDLDDEAVREAKQGQFYLSEPQRALSNNSAVYMHKPSTMEFMDEWLALMKSGSGERGIFNRGALLKTLPERRLKVLDDYVGDLGTNPCGEIILKSKQFCNLSEVVCRFNDTEESLLRKIRLATIIGTYQSTLTNFSYLSKEWKKNCEKERLLGVSLTGQWDSKVIRNASILEKLKKEAIKVNKVYAKRFGINESTAITCVKPSGTVSQLVDSASGMHPRHSEYYIRRIRISATDALFKMLKDQGVPYYPEVGQSLESATTYVLEFPVRAPGGSIFKDDLSALEQLEHWKLVKVNYTEHNPSVTISVGDDEWITVANWIYENWEIIGGLTFLPRLNYNYPMAPYEEVDKERYEELLKKVEHIDFSKIITYEKEDETEVKKELACTSGTCEI